MAHGLSAQRAGELAVDFTVKLRLISPTEGSRKIEIMMASGDMMFRLKVLLSFIFVCALPLALTGCLSLGGPMVWEYYDKCSAQTSSFLAMAECGKQARTADCVPTNDCSSMGNTYVQFTDALVLAVKNKEMTEAEAMRRYAEYKSSLIQADRRDDAIRDAGRAAAGPVPIPASDAPKLSPPVIPCARAYRTC